MSRLDGNDDFKKSAVFLNELDDGTGEQTDSRKSAKSIRYDRDTEKGLFGMRPGQGFIIAAMLFLLVFLVGAAVLVLMGKMVLPF